MRLAQILNDTLVRRSVKGVFEIYNNDIFNLPEFEIKKKNNLGDYVVEALKEAIFSGKLPPGSRIVEEQLAKVLNISKTPIREALSVLQNEGIVKSVPYQGKFVASISPEQFIEAYVVRGAIESLAVSLAVNNATPEFDSQLDKLFEASREAIENKNTAKFLECDDRLHALIFQTAGNSSLNHVYGLLKSHIKLGKVTTAYKNLRLANSLKEHEDIITCIKKRDAEAAAQAMRAHITNLIEAVSTTLKNRQLT